MAEGGDAGKLMLALGERDKYWPSSKNAVRDKIRQPPAFMGV